MAMTSQKHEVGMTTANERDEEAKKGNNTVVPLISCVKEYATIGEIFDTLREVWGEFRATSQVL